MLAPSGFETVRQPIHLFTIVALGLHLLDNQDFEPIAEACRRLGRYTFFYVVAPLYLVGGTGPPARGWRSFRGSPSQKHCQSIVLARTPSFRGRPPRKGEHIAHFKLASRGSAV